MDFRLWRKHDASASDVTANIDFAKEPVLLPFKDAGSPASWAQKANCVFRLHAEILPHVRVNDLNGFADRIDLAGAEIAYM